MNAEGKMASEAGLTLVELVVVLVILVLVAGTALTASGALVDESRFESTASELRHIESALLGAYDSSSSGEPAAISFVADVGRLPKVRAGTADVALRELWTPSDLPLPPFSIQAPAGDPQVRLPAGWRGPYLRLGFGTARLVDGWGHPYVCLSADGMTQVPVDAEIAILVSLGANGAPELLPRGGDYDADLPLILHSTDPAQPVARHRGSVPVRVTDVGTEGTVYVRIYGAREGRIVTLEQFEETAAGSDVVHVFENVPIGPRALRAYRSATAPETIDTPFDAPAVRSPIRAITVVQGGIPEVLLELP